MQAFKKTLTIIAAISLGSTILLAGIFIFFFNNTSGPQQPEASETQKQNSWTDTQHSKAKEICLSLNGTLTDTVYSGPSGRSLLCTFPQGNCTVGQLNNNNCFEQTLQGRTPDQVKAKEACQTLGGSDTLMMSAESGELEIVCSFDDGACSQQELGTNTCYKVERTVSVAGYYMARKETDWGNIPVTCPALLVSETTGGDAGLIEKFITLVQQDNTVNSIDPITGKLVLNISVDSLSAEHINLIQSSTAASPVQVELVEKLGIGHGVSACHSFVDIVNVQKK